MKINTEGDNAPIEFFDRFKSNFVNSHNSEMEQKSFQNADSSIEFETTFRVNCFKHPLNPFKLFAMLMSPGEAIPVEELIPLISKFKFRI